MLLCLALNQGWVTKQVDFSNAFIQADMDKDVYVILPQGFSVPEGANPPSSYALKLNKSLYRLCGASMYWFFHLKENLEQQGLKKSKIDPCLFLGWFMCPVLC